MSWAIHLLAYKAATIIERPFASVHSFPSSRRRAQGASIAPARVPCLVHAHTRECGSEASAVLRRAGPRFRRTRRSATTRSDRIPSRRNTVARRESTTRRPSTTATERELSHAKRAQSAVPPRRRLRGVRRPPREHNASSLRDHSERGTAARRDGVASSEGKRVVWHESSVVVHDRTPYTHTDGRTPPPSAMISERDRRSTARRRRPSFGEGTDQRTRFPPRDGD